MTRTASIFFSCQIHKICCQCAAQFSDTSSCLFCKKLSLRYYEKSSGKCYINPYHLLLHQRQSSSNCDDSSSLQSRGNTIDSQSGLSLTSSYSGTNDSFWDYYMSDSATDLSTKSSVNNSSNR